MDLSVHHQAIGSLTVLSVSGEVDLATLPRLADALTRTVGGPNTVVVDLDGVLVLDDAGLGLLLGAAGRARQAGGELSVVCSSPALREHLALTGFDRAVTVVDRITQLA
jgi:anti-sigma B factor antagonist